MISFRDLRTPEDISRWISRLNSKWPERAEVMAHICDQLRRLLVATPHIIELGFGSGLLAKYLLTELPHLTYTGLDSSELLLTYAQEILAPYGDRVRLLQADLNSDSWPNLLSEEIHAIISLQSLHDLGGEAQLNRIYATAKTLLVPGGLFLNADLVVPSHQENPKNPGRRSIPRHLELLESHGYERISCTLAVGEFGCVVAFVPSSPLPKG